MSLQEERGTYLGNYLHSISVSADGTRAYMSYWDGGFVKLWIRETADEIRSQRDFLTQLDAAIGDGALSAGTLEGRYGR